MTAREASSGRAGLLGSDRRLLHARVRRGGRQARVHSALVQALRPQPCQRCVPRSLRGRGRRVRVSHALLQVVQLRGQGAALRRVLRVRGLQALQDLCCGCLCLRMRPCAGGASKLSIVACHKQGKLFQVRCLSHVRAG